MKITSTKTVLVPFPVTLCPPGRAEGALPFSFDPIEDASGPLDLSAPCEDEYEVSTTVEGDGREEEDVFYSRPLRLR